MTVPDNILLTLTGFETPKTIPVQTSGETIVLMDLQVPEMDGFETLSPIRNPDSKVKNRMVPIIALKAHVMNGDRERCLDAGFDDFIGKPIDYQQPVKLTAGTSAALNRHA